MSDEPPISSDLEDDNMFSEMTEKQVIWESGVDNSAWHVKVVRETADRGTLSVTKKDGEQILSEPVSLSYGAMFGPDVSDVQEWQAKAIEAIDSQIDAEALVKVHNHSRIDGGPEPKGAEHDQMYPDCPVREASDDELPGMWEHSDFMGGQIDAD